MEEMLSPTLMAKGDIIKVDWEYSALIKRI